MAFDHLSLYIHISEVFEPVSCCLWQSDHCWIFYYHYINKNSFQKENLHYEIVAFLCCTWSIFLNFSWQDMHNSLFFLEKKSEIWNAFTLFEKWKVNLFFLSLISRVKSEIKMPWNRDREWKVKWKCPEIEIEKWNWKKILENSRETRLSQGTVSWFEYLHNFLNCIVS